MFWMRLFGARRAITRSSFEDLTLCRDSLEKPGKGGNSRISISYVPQDIYDHGNSLVPLDAPLKSRRRSSSRRSAIDLVRTEPSVEFGSGTGMRFSMDGNSSMPQTPCSLQATYTNFATKHRGRNSKILGATSRHTGERVVLKVFNKSTMSSSQKEDVVKELRILKSAKGCKGVAQLAGSYEDENYVSFIMKDIPGGTLINRIAAEGGTMTEEVCIHKVILPLVEALCWLHEHNIVHRDLKPEHILFDSSGRIKIVDFLSSATLGKDAMLSREGTIAYMAPEMLSKPSPEEIFHEVICGGVDEADLPSYNEKVDIWSVGVIAVECLTGRQPFLADGVREMLAVQREELEGCGSIGVWDSMFDSGFISTECKDFLSSVFSVDPDDRPSAAELLQHPWLELLSPTSVADFCH